MSTLIKSSDMAHGFVIQRLGSEIPMLVTPQKALQADLENPLEVENKRLITLLEEHNAVIVTHKSALTKAFSEGEEAGRTAMEAEIEDDRAAALALLGEGIDAAKNELGHALENAESIALMVAQMALDKMFGTAEERKAAITDLIRHQFRQIGNDSFVSLEVSRTDFPNTREVAELSAALSIAPDTVRVSDELNAGDCRMRMQLGSLAIGLNRQWGAIRTLLEDMAVVGESEQVA